MTETSSQNKFTKWIRPLIGGTLTSLIAVASMSIMFAPGPPDNILLVFIAIGFGAPASLILKAISLVDESNVILILITSVFGLLQDSQLFGS